MYHYKKPLTINPEPANDVIEIRTFDGPGPPDPDATLCNTLSSDSWSMSHYYYIIIVTVKTHPLNLFWKCHSNQMLEHIRRRKVLQILTTGQRSTLPTHSDEVGWWICLECQTGCRKVYSGEFAKHLYYQMSCLALYRQLQRKIAKNCI